MAYGDRASARRHGAGCPWHRHSVGSHCGRRGGGPRHHRDEPPCPRLSGILLLALTLIPENIHGLMTKAATVILIVGALIVAAAVANGSWLKERQHGT